MRATARRVKIMANLHQLRAILSVLSLLLSLYIAEVGFASLIKMPTRFRHASLLVAQFLASQRAVDHVDFVPFGQLRR
jgi:hypothetical protein